ncbi:MAG: hypothetical protein AB7V16_12265 [Vulcanibacillus sp.]
MKKLLVFLTFSIIITELITADNITTHQKIAEICFEEIYSKSE